MPLGNLTSQFFANIYLNEMDYFVKHVLRAKYYIRYVDDFVILHTSQKQLEKWKIEINNFLREKLRLDLHSQKSRIIPLSRGIDFVGFRNFAHFRLLRARNIKKMMRKIKLFSEGEITYQILMESFQGWQAYAKWANTLKLRRKIAREIYTIKKRIMQEKKNPQTLKTFSIHNIYKYVFNTYYMQNVTKFIHRVSKGSRFNQIYVPKEYEQVFQEGDIVQVMLLEKRTKLYYSKNLKKLSEFKEKLIKDIFSELSTFKEIKQVFIFGSFLTKNVDYNDIDVLVLNDKDIEETVYNSLIKKFNLKFHVIAIDDKNLKKVLEICPLVRSMLYRFVSNKPFIVQKDTRIDRNHIRFLLMLPEDLLEIELDSKMFYEAIRRLTCIEYFLEDNEIAPDKIDGVLSKTLDNLLLERIKKDEQINNKNIAELRTIIKHKLKKIKGLLKNGKE